MRSTHVEDSTRELPWGKAIRVPVEECLNEPPKFFSTSDNRCNFVGIRTLAGVQLSMKRYEDAYKAHVAGNRYRDLEVMY